MNQELEQQIQAQTKEQRMLDQADFLVANKKVRRSPVKESRNIWMVGSYSMPKKWYVVRWNEESNCFMCACKAFEFSSDNTSLHIMACALFEGTEEESN